MQKKAVLSLFLTSAMLFVFVVPFVWAQGYVGSTWTDEFMTDEFVDYERTEVANVIVDLNDPGLVYLAPGRTGQADDGTADRPFQDRIDLSASENIVLIGDDVAGGDMVRMQNQGEYFEDFITYSYRNTAQTTATWDTSGVGELRIPEDDRWIIDYRDLEQGFRLRDIYWPDEDHGWIVGDAGRVMRTTDKGENWVDLFPPEFVGTNLHAVFFLDVENGWVVGEQGNAWASTDGGDTWNRIQSAQFFNNRDLNDVFFIERFGERHGWIIGNDGRIWYQDPQQDWSLQSVDNVGSNLNHIYFVGEAGEFSGYIVGDYNTYLEYNFDSVEWNKPEVTGLPEQAQNLQSVFFSNTDVGWIVGTSGTVLRTRNSGSSWSDMGPNGLENLEVTDIFFINDDVGYMVTRTGRIYKTTNGSDPEGGVVWIFQNVRFPNGQIDTDFGEDLHAVFFPNEGSGWTVGALETRLHNPFYVEEQDFYGVSRQVNDVYFNPELTVRSVIFDSGLMLDDCEGDECIVEAFVSVDGGQSWVEVTAGELVNFANPNNDLRWRMRLRTNNSNVTPRVDWLSMVYTTSYDTASPGIYTSLPEDMGFDTGYPEKNKSFTSLQWLTAFQQGTDVTMQYSVDGGPWIDATPDGEPVFDDGALLYTHTMNEVSGNNIRYRAFLSTDDPTVSPTLYEVRQGYGYVPSGSLMSNEIFKLNAEARWQTLSFARNLPTGTGLNVDIMHESGEAVFQDNITSTSFDMSGQSYNAEGSLRLRVDLTSNTLRNSTPSLDRWYMDWLVPPTPGLIFFATEDGDILDPKEYTGIEDVFVRLEDADRNSATNARDIIPASDVELVSATTGDSEHISLLEISQNAGVFTNAPNAGVPLNLAEESDGADTGLLTVVPQDTIWVYYTDSVHGDRDNDRAFVIFATPSTVQFVNSNQDPVTGYLIGDESIFVLVEDLDQNQNPNASETVYVTVLNDENDQEEEVLECTELTNQNNLPDTGRFFCGPLASSEDLNNTAPNNGTLFTQDLDIIRAIYRDPDPAPVDTSVATAQMALPAAPEPIDDVFDNLIIAPNPHYWDDDDVIIRFDVNPDTFLSGEVHIYNIAGEWVTMIGNEDIILGPHPTKPNVWVRRATWDLTNHNGQDVMSGTYFIHVIGTDSTHGKKEETVKLVVIR